MTRPHETNYHISFRRNNMLLADFFARCAASKDPPTATDLEYCLDLLEANTPDLYRQDSHPAVASTVSKLAIVTDSAAGANHRLDSRFPVSGLEAKTVNETGHRAATIERLSGIAPASHHHKIPESTWKTPLHKAATAYSGAAVDRQFQMGNVPLSSVVNKISVFGMCQTPAMIGRAADAKSDDMEFVAALGKEPREAVQASSKSPGDFKGDEQSRSIESDTTPSRTVLTGTAKSILEALNVKVIAPEQAKESTGSERAAKSSTPILRLEPGKVLPEYRFELFSAPYPPTAMAEREEEEEAVSSLPHYEFSM